MTTQARTAPRARSTAAVLLATAALWACGGGDGDDNKEPSAPPQPVVTPACTDCGAAAANAYTGTGVGVWQAINATSKTVDIPVRISGLNGQDVTLVFTNHSSTPKTMPTIALTTSHTTNVAASALRLDDAARDAKRRISDFNREGWVKLAGKRGATPNYAATSSPRLAAIDDVRTWYHFDDSARSGVLVRQLSASDGTTINFWVEETENTADRVSPEIVSQLADSFVEQGRIYDMLKSVGGPVWGPHNYANMISATGQPIDIVILNFDNNSRPYGAVGYFYGRNAFQRNATTNSRSNESVSLYLDAETLYLGGANSLRHMQMTMAHEALHMQNFYRRGVVQGPSHVLDTWLEEASAMMMEDFAGHSIDPGYNAVRDGLFPDYVGYKAGSYNCNLTAWTPFAEACESYSVSGSFGGFLNRQLGLDFYKNLLTDFSSTDAVKVLDSAIRSVQPQSSFVEQFRRFGATSASLMKSPSPVGFGFPARRDGSFELPVIDPQMVLPLRTLTQSIPTTLEAYASLPVVRTAVSGTYSETVPVPAGSTLSVVIQ